MSHKRAHTTRHGSRRKPSAFRDAFDRARLESLGGDAELPDELTEAPVGAGSRRRFEVRIERRRSRRADLEAWNRLGERGWELVGVTGRHAFFRRERTR